MLPARNKSIEELLAVLDREEDEVLKYSDDMLGFISVYDLKPGRKPVNVSLLYKLYKNWSVTPLRQLEFINRFAEYFVVRKKNTRTYFNLSETAFDIAGDLIEKLSREEKKFRQYQIRAVRKFLFKNGVKTGTHWVEHYVLYTIYVNWCYDNKILNYCSAEHFTKIAKLFLESRHHTDGEYYYSVNKSLIRTLLTPNRVAAIKRWHQKRYSDKKEKSKKQK